MEFLPPYVILWIVDWLDVFKDEYLSHQRKIALITKIRNFRRRVLAARERSVKAVDDDNGVALASNDDDDDVVFSTVPRPSSSSSSVSIWRQLLASVDESAHVTVAEFRAALIAHCKRSSRLLPVLRLSKFFVAFLTRACTHAFRKMSLGVSGCWQLRRSSTMHVQQAATMVLLERSSSTLTTPTRRRLPIGCYATANKEGCVQYAALQWSYVTN